jgi:hypothetical protein
MRALPTSEATGIGIRRFGLGSYIVVGLLAAAVGVGAVTGLNAITGEDEASIAGQAAAVRAEGAGENLAGLWQSGLAQSAAINEYAIVQSRVEAGLAQAAAIAEHNLLQGRIEAGLAQKAVIERQRAFQEAWEMRGAEMTRVYGHLVPNSFDYAWAMRGEAMTDHVSALTSAGLAQREAIANR